MGLGRTKQQTEVSEAKMVDESLQQAGELDWKPNTQQLMVMFVLSVISFMVSLDATIIVTSLSSVVEDLNGTTTQGIWIGTAYLLSNCAAMPFLASISDIFGRPITLVFSVVLFTIASIVCATTSSIGQLLAGRAIQGIGGGGIIVISLVTFTDIVPLRHRPKWWGTVQGAWALGTCVGPTMGGAVVRATWRWIFYVMLPLCAFGLITIPLVLTIKPRTETVGAKLKRVDWVGNAIFMASATSFLMAISWGGTQFAWSSASTIAPLVIGAAGLIGSAAWERYVAKNPFMRHELFRSASAIAIYICSAMQGLLLTGQLYYAPLYFMSVLAYSPIMTGVAMLPFMLVLVPSSIVAGIFITRYGNYRYPIWAGWAVCSIGCGLICMWGQDTHVAVWVISLAIVALGHGATLNAQNFAAQAVCEPGDEAHAASTYSFMRHFGMALGVGIGGTTFQNVMARKCAWLGLPTAIAKNAESYIATVLAMPASQEKHDIISAYVYGLRGVFWVYLGISLVSFCVSLLIKHYDMNKELRTEHTLEDNKLSRAVEARFSTMPPGAAGATAFSSRQSTLVRGGDETPLSAIKDNDEESPISSGASG
ncbi:unnamed protein product [Discula destructiva]